MYETDTSKLYLVKCRILMFNYLYLWEDCLLIYTYDHAILYCTTYSSPWTLFNRINNVLRLEETMFDMAGNNTAHSLRRLLACARQFAYFGW